MSARNHLLVSWCGRLERTGEEQPPAAPVEQWLGQLLQDLRRSGASTEGLLLQPAPNPLARSNFDPDQPLSCDRRQLEARQWLERDRPEPIAGLAWPQLLTLPSPLLEITPSPPELDVDALLVWLQRPQAAWLQQRGLRPGEGIDPVDDLDGLELDGLQRYQLLEQELDRHPLDDAAPDWVATHRGQGVLPAGSGAALEQASSATLADPEPTAQGLGACRREAFPGRTRAPIAVCRRRAGGGTGRSAQCRRCDAGLAAAPVALRC